MSPTPSSISPPAANLAHRRILRAATEAFAAHGYAATSVGQLLDSAQIDLPTFEAHFNDTDDCFLQAHDSIVAEAAARIVASLPDPAPWPQRLAAGLSTLFELVEANPGAARLVLVEAQCAFPEALARYLPTIGRVAPFMHEGRVLPGADPDIPPITDYAYPGGVAFMLTSRLRERPGEPVADLFPEALRLLILPYLGNEQTTAFLATATLPEAVKRPG